MQTPLFEFRNTLQDLARNSEGSDHKYLAVKREASGYIFSAVHLTRLDKLKRIFGFGDTCPKKVARALLREKEYLKQISKDLWQSSLLDKKDVKVLQVLIHRIFAAAKKTEDAINLYEDKHAFWMGDLPNAIKKKDIHEILLPGTHDSAAYHVDFNHTLPRFKKLKQVVRFLPFVGTIIANWTKTQDKNFYDQLRVGIRYFDFRISYHLEEKKFYLTHTFTCVPLEEALNDINRFMKEHPEEVLVISAESDWEHREDMKNIENEKEMVKLVENKLRNILCPPTVIQNGSEAMTLENLVKNNHRIIFYYESRAGHADQLPSVWVVKPIKGSGWINSSNPEDNIKGIEKKLANVNTKEQDFFCISFTLTPQVRDIVHSIIEKIFLPWKKMTSLKEMAKSFEPKMNDYLINQAEKLKKVSVISTDFPNDQFVNHIVEANLFNHRI